MVKIDQYDDSAGIVILDDQSGHPGIRATSFDYCRINDEMLALLDKPSPSYYLLLLGFLMALGLGALSLAIQIDVGIGYSGISHPIAWGFYITNFVFWIGIGHAGTLISAVFYLTRAPWRTAIYRSAEAMTVFGFSLRIIFFTILKNLKYFTKELRRSFL